MNNELGSVVHVHQRTLCAVQIIHVDAMACAIASIARAGSRKIASVARH
jgi:hypothetical protein